MVTVFYIIYFDGTTRFSLIGDNIINNINDFFGLIQIYHYMCFTDFNQDNMKKFELGFTMVISMAIMMALNVGVMIFKSVKEGRRMRRLKTVKKRKLQAFEVLQVELQKQKNLKLDVQEHIRIWKAEKARKRKIKETADRLHA